MRVELVEVLVEEPSMEAALRAVLPQILGRISFQVYQHACKGEFLSRLPQRLAGYARRRKNDIWFRDHCRIVVVVDRDNEDCHELKAHLENLARAAKLTTRTSAGNKPYAVVNRLAIEELEAWYFGDWKAVRAAYPRVNPNVPLRAKYRNPDAITGGTWEAFERLLKNAGYFKTGLRKIEAARAVAAHMDPARNNSHSFQVLRAALSDMVPT